ncbi:carbohydrate kinase family protein [Cohaesibacter celericrescens]|uniref:Carbohydrate kinase family protein n=1 Tax=Cohaesibacter celericrescens TaxID=2067669 RepID=A0A2N5XNK5_9HYPH|nr:carbohydrate kinase family protein [Cohaesibacter celericrescens]PLW76116.1 carbohydrate kinase family protein [Cohaesibacter celericrescens]
MNRQGIICAGNWIVDIVHEIDQWPNKSELATILREKNGVGGGAANVVMALSHLDCDFPLVPFGAIGQDDHSRIILDACMALDLPIDHLIRRSDIPTAHTHVMSVPGDSRTFFYHGGANDSLSQQDFTTGFFAQSNARIFYLGYLMLLEQLDRIENGTSGAAQILARAQKAGLTTCVDLVSASSENFSTIVSYAAPYINYLIVNEVEACRASQIPLATDTVPPDVTLIEAARTLLASGINDAVIIHCPEKALWLGQNAEPILMRPDRLPPEAIVSPVGAGDAFCSGILYGIHEGLSPDKTLILAHTIATASMTGVTATESIPPLKQLMPEVFDQTQPHD